MVELWYIGLEATLKLNIQRGVEVGKVEQTIISALLP